MVTRVEERREGKKRRDEGERGISSACDREEQREKEIERGKERKRWKRHGEDDASYVKGECRVAKVTPTS